MQFHVTVPVALSLLANRRSHGAQDAHGQEDHETKKLLAEHMIAQPGRPGCRTVWISCPRLDQRRNYPEPVRNRERQHAGKENQCFTRSSFPYGVANRLERLPIRNQLLTSPDPKSVATATYP